MIQVTFRNVSPTDALRAYAERRANKLYELDSRITSLHVTIESPHKHHAHGNAYRVVVEAHAPGHTIVSGHQRPDDPRFRDAYAAIDDAVDDAVRRVHDARDKQAHPRHAAHHLRPSRGRVAKLFVDDGYGFLESETGEEIYFHENSVLGHGFDRLAIGTRVRYAEEIGDKGPQASTVTIVH